MTLAQDRGHNGEIIAAKYLLERGYSIDGRNIRFGRYELDIVAYDPTEKMVVFVEVKTRSTHTEQYPIHTAMTAQKRAALRKAIARWARAKNHDGPGRIDLISVKGEHIVEHIIDIGSDFY